MNSLSYIGAEWVRCDLHLHSPGINTFVLPSGTNISSTKAKDEIVGIYIDKLKDANIKIGAITDYNIIRQEWFLPIQQRAKEENINIFPGVELAIGNVGGKYGLHMLIIFNEDEDIDGINRFIHSLDKNPNIPLVSDNGKHRDLESQYITEDIVRKIRDNYKKTIIVFCHPEDNNGIFKSFQPKECSRLIKSIKPDALEYISDFCKNKLVSTGELSKSELNKIAIIENSDPKNLDEIGSKSRNGKVRATYLKVSEHTLNAMILALRDPEIRIKLYESPKLTYNKIINIAIKGTQFLNDVNIALNPEINTLIGGRGVGKSALIEAIRYCLKLPVYDDVKAKNDFVHNVVGSSGEIIIEVEKYYGDKSKKYEICRILGKEPEMREKGGDNLYYNPLNLFDNNPPIAIGQKELYALTKFKEFQLKLVDDLIGEEFRIKQKEFNELLGNLKDNGKEIVELKKKLAKKAEYEEELRIIEDNIKTYQSLGVADKLKRLTDIIEDEQRLHNSKNMLMEAIDDIDVLLTSLSDKLHLQLDYLKKAQSEGKDVLIRSSQIILKAINLIENTFSKLIALRNDIRGEYDDIESEWLQIKARVEKEVEDTKRQLSEKKLRPEEFEAIIKRRSQLKPAVAELKKIEGILEDKRKRRDEIKNELKRKRHSLFTVRKDEIEKNNKILEGKLRLIVEFETNKLDFIDKLKIITKGSGIHISVIDKIVNKENLTLDGLLISQYITSERCNVANIFGITEIMAEKLIDWFKDEEKLFELETLFPEDKIIIELNINGEYRDIEFLSAGQKATALLLLLFAYQNRILILDQPEEDLDNRFIYDDIVTLLRKFKGKRQFIIATHNANIPVLGDAEMIVVLEGKSDTEHIVRCMVVDRGSIDKENIRSSVKNIMEGGEEAFKKRAEKYGGIL